jgi:hypothetical protein
MTEADWQACGKPDLMLRHLQQPRAGPALRRKLRLFACGCCRLAWDLVTDPAARLAVEVAERSADGQATAQQRESARVALRYPDPPHLPPWNTPAFLAVVANEKETRLWDAAHEAAALFVSLRLKEVLGPSPLLTPASDWKRAQAERARCQAEQRSRVCDLVREIFGNPFHPAVRVRAEVLNWSDGIARQIAVGVYEEGAFERLPILADALEEAGCTEDELLAHLRAPGVHVRGCWALDRILAEE